MDPRTREQLDVCRPGHADWEDAELTELAAALRSSDELRDLAARLEDLDEAIASALMDVAPPPGLAQRIMARLDQSPAPGSSQASGGVAVSEPPADVALERHTLDFAAPVVAGYEDSSEGGAQAVARPPSEDTAPAEPCSPPAPTPAAASSEPSSANRGINRRKWLVAAAAAAAATVLAVVLWPSGAPRLGPNELINAVDHLYVQQLRQHEGWHTVADSAALSLPRDVLARPVAWRKANVLGAAAVAYDVQNTQGRRAVLMAISCQGVGLPTAPPSQPQSSSGRLIAAWRSPQANTVYVLVVEGTVADYQAFVALGQSLT